MAEISRLTKLSQQYVQQAQAVADRLLDAETAEEIDGLELESNKYVELAEQCARELAVQRADAAGLRAELARTETDEKRKAAGAFHHPPSVHGDDTSPRSPSGSNN